MGVPKVWRFCIGRDNDLFRQAPTTNSKLQQHKSTKILKNAHLPPTNFVQHYCILYPGSVPDLPHLPSACAGQRFWASASSSNHSLSGPTRDDKTSGAMMPVPPHCREAGHHWYHSILFGCNPHIQQPFRSDRRRRKKFCRFPMLTCTKTY